MKKITMFSIFLAAFFLGCEKDTSKKEIKPQNGKWVGSYVDSIPQDREDIGFEMNDRELSTIEVSIYFSNLTFYKIFHCNSLLTENSFRYESGQISSNGGKTVIEGNFTSETECNGTVSFEENSANGIGQAHYVFNATPTGHSQPILVPNIASLREGARDGTIYRLTGEVVVIYATSSYNRNHKYIQDSTGGLLIDDVQGIISTVYDRYDGITGITGTLVDYRGTLELIPNTDPGAATSTGNSITPQVISIQELNTNIDRYESTLVKVTGVTFDIADGSRIFVSGGNEANYMISSGANKLVFRVHYPELEYVNEIIPSGPHNITGIAIEYNGVSELFARDKTDIVSCKKIK